MGLYESLATLLPNRWAKSLRKELDYIGIDVNEKRFLGFLLGFGILLSLGISANLYYLLQLPVFVSFPIMLAAFGGLTFMWLGIASESKGKFVEKILPDALQLIASNLKAGMTTERALLASARPEFGPLADELQESSKRVLTGESVDAALENISNKIKSKTLDQTIWLVNRGINSGGQMSELLSTLSNDLRDQNVLKAEIQSNVSVYVILILFSSMIGAPVMLGISSFIVQILTIQSSKVGISTEQLSVIQSRSSVIGIPQSHIDPAFVGNFALLLTILTAFFSALAVGIINGGKEKNGLRYALFMIPISAVIFFAARWALMGSFGYLLG